MDVGGIVDVEWVGVLRVKKCLEVMEGSGVVVEIEDWVVVELGGYFGKVLVGGDWYYFGK